MEKTKHRRKVFANDSPEFVLNYEGGLIAVYFIVFMAILWGVSSYMVYREEQHEMKTREIVQEEVEKGLRKEFGPFPEWTRQNSG